MAQKKKAFPITAVAPLYGRCITVALGNPPLEHIELKLMGEREQATETRNRLLAAFALMGIPVEEAK